MPPCGASTEGFDDAEGSDSEARLESVECLRESPASRASPAVREPPILGDCPVAAEPFASVSLAVVVGVAFAVFGLDVAPFAGVAPGDGVVRLTVSLCPCVFAVFAAIAVAAAVPAGVVEPPATFTLGKEGSSPSIGFAGAPRETGEAVAVVDTAAAPALAFPLGVAPLAGVDVVLVVVDAAGGAASARLRSVRGSGSAGVAGEVFRVVLVEEEETSVGGGA